MKQGKQTPVRTCMGCGERAPQHTLLRVALRTGGELAVVQRGHSHSGRSGYLHERPECWRRFTARKGRVRSLGSVVDRDVRVACVREIESSRSVASTR